MSKRSQYNAKIAEFNNIKSNVSRIISDLNKCKTDVSKTSKEVESLVINGKPIDDGALMEISSSLELLKGDLSQIINECNEKIDYYTNLLASLSNESDESVNL